MLPANAIGDGFEVSRIVTENRLRVIGCIAESDRRRHGVPQSQQGTDLHREEAVEFGVGTQRKRTGMPSPEAVHFMSVRKVAESINGIGVEIAGNPLFTKTHSGLNGDVLKESKGTREGKIVCPAVVLIMLKIFPDECISRVENSVSQ